MIRFTILGEPASKANSRKLAYVRDKKTGQQRMMFIKANKALEYEKWALVQIPPACRVQMIGRVAVTLRMFYATERPDMDESLLLDILQDRYTGTGEKRRLVQKGVYRNDRQVRERHVYHSIDKRNPRVEIEVHCIEPQLALPQHDDHRSVQSAV